MPNQPDAVRLPNYQNNPRILPLGEWLPDQMDYANPGATGIVNAIPVGPSSYGPIKNLSSLGYGVLAQAPLGLFSFTDVTGGVHVFAATAGHIYRVKAGDTVWQDVTKSATTYSASYNNPWFFTTLGVSRIIATNGVDAPQNFVIGSSALFTDLAGTPPIGRYVTTVRDFVMFGNCTEGGVVFPQRIHWSAIGDATTWPTTGTNAAAAVQSDSQDLRSDLGHIRGLASNLQSSDFAVFMDRGVYSGNYVGSPAVFALQIAQGATGLRIPRSLVTHRGIAYYYGNDGFYAFDGVNPRPIGSQKVDSFFLNDSLDGVDQGFLHLTQGAADPSGKCIYWAYCGANSNGTPSRLLIYNWALDRWGFARLRVNGLCRALTIGYTLDQLDTFGTVDTLSYSLDSPTWLGGSNVLFGFDNTNNLGTFSGYNLAATMTTSEAELTPGRRSRVTSGRPLVDVGQDIGVVQPTITLTIGGRNYLGETVLYNSSGDTNIYGACSLRSDARYHRAAITVPQNATWKHCGGAQLDYTQSTKR